MPTTINASNTTGGAVVTGDGSGVLELQSGGVTGITVNGANVTVAGTLTATGGMTGVLPVASGGTGASTLPANAVLVGNGTSAVGSVAPGSSGNILTSNGTSWVSATPSGSTLTAVASGSLSNGSCVVMNISGTVSAVSGAAQTLGTPVVFESASTDAIGIAYDAAQSRIVIAYRDWGNSFWGTVVVGSVSGSSISFGTPAVFVSSNSSFYRATYDTSAQRVVVVFRDAGAVPANSGNASSFEVSGSSTLSRGVAKFSNNVVTNIAITYDATAARVVVAYTDSTNSSYGTVAVGTVLASSLSFGTPVVFESASTGSIGIAYDANALKVVIAYRDVGNSSYGTAIVGTVSGTSISFGTPVVFESASTSAVSVVYDSDTQKIVIAYADNGNSSYGTAIVGTVSGTDISFGAASVFFPGGLGSTSAAYDPSIQRVVISYSDPLNSSYGTSVAGAVVGTNISFAQGAVFESANTSEIASVYAPNATRVVTAYTDGGNSSYGTAVPFRAATSNLGSQNFIGISSGAYTDGQTATIQIIGAVDDAQSGLVPGRSYYVQIGGSLSQTPASPSVFAGTAVAADKIIVKG